MPFLTLAEKNPDTATIFAKVVEDRMDGGLKKMSVSEVNELVESQSWQIVSIAGSKAETGDAEIDIGCLGTNYDYFNLSIASANSRKWFVSFAEKGPKISVFQLELNNISSATLPALLDRCLGTVQMMLREMAVLKPSIYIPTLQYLTISGKNVRNIPDGISQSADIKRLTITDTSLTSVSDEISQMKKLCTVNFSNNRLRSCPPLPHVEQLHLNDNDFREIPEWIAEQIAASKKLKEPHMILHLAGNPAAYGMNTLRGGQADKSGGHTTFSEISDAKYFVRNRKAGRIIDLRKNKIPAIPPWIFTSSSFVVLHQAYAPDDEGTIQPDYHAGGSKVWMLPPKDIR